MRSAEPLVAAEEIDNRIKRWRHRVRHAPWSTSIGESNMDTVEDVLDKDEAAEVRTEVKKQKHRRDAWGKPTSSQSWRKPASMHSGCKPTYHSLEEVASARELLGGAGQGVDSQGERVLHPER